MKLLRFLTLTLSFSLTLVLIKSSANAQAPIKPASGKILQDLKKLNVLGSLLHIGAHPDDENTTMISYMANHKLYNTAYLSLTRGDGGQNLIGPEIREGLGVIRTQELLQARRTDGGRQFFTRANDFGFSKNPEEVFSIWNRETLLADVVWVIRNFKPDVIVTRFPKDSRAGHGQHSVSSILAEDAFTAAADPKRFPEQLKYVEVWQAKRLLWNLSSWAFRDPKEFDKVAKTLLKVDVGAFNPLLGKSYGEISAESRSMHKSQGFGSTGSRGAYMDYFQHTLGDSAKTDLFEGVNTNWSRLKGSAKVQLAINKAIAGYNGAEPSKVVADLLLARTELLKLQDSFWKKSKLQEIETVIKDASGLYLEATASNFAATPGELVKVQIEAINRSAVPITITSIVYPFKGDSIVNSPLENNTGKKFLSTVQVPKNADYSQPYWLKRPDSLGLFFIDKQEDVGLPENRPAANVTINLTVGGIPFKYTVPVVYKYNHPVNGEIYQPFIITPPAFANIQEKVYMFANGTPKQVSVVMRSGKENATGKLELKLPDQWKVEPASFPFNMTSEGLEETFKFMVSPPSKSHEAEMQAEITIDGKTYSNGLNTIKYDHFPAQVSFPASSAKAVKLDLNKKGEKIGYLMGAGDELPGSLEQIGYEVTLLKDGDINQESLKKYDAVILGVRAYNTVDRIGFFHERLMDYVKEGGNLIVQYNTNNGLKVLNPGPYPFKISRERVTVEGSGVTLLMPEHAVLNIPNKITKADFDGWVQERGLYYPNEWSKEYQAIVASGDAGESQLNGGLLIAKHGKGNFIYTGFSWFRQLPAGVPGAYRIFTNLISLGK
ncbi:PIG-L family deacetylase [Daejeonella oryzae]|uniref:PIG-L family deacetylase n=1 Tax=Daejeonella oryzae TaxID=1122943 RepID=UPI000424EE7A|nr:PIG-L family deacetylase [Daejeonella oryzae]